MLCRSLCWSVWVVVLWIVVPDKQSGLMFMDLASIVASAGPQCVHACVCVPA